VAFDDVMQRMGKRHGVAPTLLADRAALTRKSERDRYLAMVFGGLGLVALVGAPTIALASTGWWMPGASGLLVFGGCLATAHGVEGLRTLRR
jgi:hypothetical protein